MSKNNLAINQYHPGSYGCHEALHMTCFLQHAVHIELCEHLAIRRNKKWMRLADKASKALADLYQAIGAEHL